MNWFDREESIVWNGAMLVRVVGWLSDGIYGREYFHVQ
jgi:hypothetical protein